MEPVLDVLVVGSGVVDENCDAPDEDFGKAVVGWRAELLEIAVGDDIVLVVASSHGM